MEIYIHIPFCVRKCAYCDFLSAPGDEEAKERYVQALCREIDTAGAFAGSEGKKRVETIFFGGGTPSLLTLPQMSRIMEHILNVYDLADGAEITVEANPGTLSEEKLKGFKALGINRLSLGLQSADDRELTRLGRIHTYEDFKQTFRLARKSGFDNLNVDIMSALPGQTLSSYIKTLEKVTGFEPEHISAYSLIIEPGTAFEKLYEAGRLNLPSEEEERRMYELTGEWLGRKGYERYEISNYARPGMMCRHNVGYWVRKDYRGFGLGAASLLDPVRFSNPSDMHTYLALYGDDETIARRLQKGFLAVRDTFEEWEILSILRQMEEFMFLGLRMCRGISEKRFLETFGVSVSDIYGTVIQEHIQEGRLKRRTDEGHNIWLALTPEGISVSNRVMADFLLD